MSTLQEAMRDAGLTRDIPQRSNDTVVRRIRPAHTAPPDAPALYTAGRVQTEQQYRGRRWNMDRFTHEAISLGPVVVRGNTLRVSKSGPRRPMPDDSARKIAEMAAVVQPDLADATAANLASLPPGVAARLLAGRRTICHTCHMAVPIGLTSCPDC